MEHFCAELLVLVHMVQARSTIWVSPVGLEVETLCTMQCFGQNWFDLCKYAELNYPLNLDFCQAYETHVCGYFMVEILNT